jgi:hypothetical protein
VTAPTVFLCVRGGFTPRFLLRTAILPTLRATGVRVVILSPNADEPYFRAEFERDGMAVERLDVAALERYAQARPAQQTLRALRLQILSDRGDLTTIDQMMAINEDTARRQGMRGRAVAAALRGVTRVARRSRAVRETISDAESRLFVPDVHAALYEKYRPSATVVTSLGFSGSEPDNYLMREAHAFGSKVIAAVLSWDNTSSKGLRGGPVDRVIAWTDAMKRELIEYHDLEAAKITVCGPPHFDEYYHPPRWSRPDLDRALGLDPARRVLTFGTKSPTNYPWNEEIAEMIARAIDDGRITEPCQLVMRLHPIYYRQRHGVYKFQAFLDRARALAARYPWVILDEPAIQSSTLALDMPSAEQHKLHALLAHSAMLINIFSTLNIEAAIVDTPCVNVTFNGTGAPTSIRCNVALDEAQPHNQRIVRSGGVAMVRSEPELIAAINAYLADPTRDAQGRARIRETEAGLYPGRAGEAIGRAIATEVGA